jgi:YD repeat-containing protein
VSAAWSKGGAPQDIDRRARPIHDLRPRRAHNQPLHFADARGNVTRYVYDAAGNRTETIYADGSIAKADYDATGNPDSLVNRRGRPSRSRTTAAAGAQETFPDQSTETVTYDARRPAQTVTTSQGVTTFAYDAADRLTRVEYPGGRWLEYDYDAAGRRIRMADHSGFEVNYTYDAAGRLESLRDAADVLIVTYSYDAAGWLQREDKANGTCTLYAYDDAGRPRLITHHAPDNSVNARFEYAYDAVGRRTGMTTLDGHWTYTYDLAGQLTHAVFDSTSASIPDQDLSYEYDALGNRVRTVHNGAATNYAANALNQYTSAGGVTFGYDLDGNVITRTEGGVTTTYAYDVLNRLVSVTRPGETWTYEYDVFSNRSAVVHNGARTEYLVDPAGLGDVVAEYGAGGLVARYTHGLGLTSRMDASGAASFYDFDVLGSTAGLTGESGLYLNRYSYLPYGERLTSVEAVANPLSSWVRMASCARAPAWTLCGRVSMRLPRDASSARTPSASREGRSTSTATSPRTR